MKKTIKLAVVAALALGATSAFATNGDNMIATGAKSAAMGGVGIATSFGSRSSLSNPALLSSVVNSEFSASMTLFMPDVSIKGNNGGTGIYQDSDADKNYIPGFSYASRINKNLVYGISVTGTAGMGIDLDQKPLAFAAGMTTDLVLAKVAIPISYQMGALSIGIAPVLQYGNLTIKNAAAPKAEDSDTGWGYEVGMAYKVTDALTLGAVYKSEIAMLYTTVLSTSITNFGAAADIKSGDALDQPAEYGVGLSYVHGANTLAIDYKRIGWSNAVGYKDFKWEDQDVYSIGYQYATKSWALRAGYNYAKSPIREQAAANSGSQINFFNLSGFPGIVESHYTFGAGYNVSDALSIDTAVVYAAENTETFATPGFSGATSTASVIHSQLGITIGGTYKF